MLWHKSWGELSFPPLIFLHGFMGSHLDFLPIIKKLSNDFFCIALDLPGHGYSKNIIPKTSKELEEHLIDTLKSYSLKEPTLVGYSMGGRVSMKVYKKIEISKLILISTRFKTLSESEALTIKKRDEVTLPSLLQDNYTLFLEKWYSSPLFKTLKNKSSLYQKMIKERTNQDPKALAIILKLLSPASYKPCPQFLKDLKNLSFTFVEKKIRNIVKVQKISTKNIQKLGFIPFQVPRMHFT